MKTKDILIELEKLKDEQIKKIYLNHGIKEPFFGIKISNLKKLAKKIKIIDHQVAMELFETNNYDAMYLTTLISDPKKYKKKDFDIMIRKSYCHEISNYIIATILSKNDLAIEMSNKWLESNNDLYKSAAYSCFSLLIKNNKNNEYFLKNNVNLFKKILNHIEKNIHNETNWTKYSMNAFIISVGCFNLYLRDYAIVVSKKIGYVNVIFPNKTNCKTPVALQKINEYIKKS